MKHLLKGTILLCVVTLLLGALSLTAVEAKANSSSWQPFQGHFRLKTEAPKVTFPGGMFLNSVATVSASDVWTVGYYLTPSTIGFVDKTLIEHWDGSQWSIVTSPNPGSTSNALGSIAAVSASDIWAVGTSSNNNSTSQTLIEHWNGTQWSVVTSPNPGSFSNALDGIVVISSGDIWAVGSFSNNSTSSQTLVEQWDGSQWSVVTSPNPGSAGNGLSSIAAVNANNLWAVGGFSSNSNSQQTLVEHWNGSKWSVVKSPNPTGSTVNNLSGVAVASANDVWAAGSGNGFSTTLIEHWNGSKWSIVQSPNPGQINLLDDIAVVSGSNIWAVGQSLAFTGQTLIEQWNGKQWSVVQSPNAPGSTNNFLSGIAVISASDIWTVGGYQDNNLAGHTLTENWDGNTWSIVPSP
ncbi:MAG TPA: hypothetical protein VFA09_08825 [Ktedonobacteraceae bacterium]|nr:hypothetical protein [Ktedonobacteraceae bacterium]